MRKKRLTCETESKGQICDTLIRDLLGSGSRYFYKSVLPSDLGTTLHIGYFILFIIYNLYTLVQCIYYYDYNIATNSKKIIIINSCITARTHKYVCVCMCAYKQYTHTHTHTHIPYVLIIYA